MHSPAGYSVRVASSVDADAVFDLARRFATSFDVQEQRFRPAFQQVVADPAACVRVAVADGAVVGYVLAFAHATFFANGPVAWVEELMVAEAHRRRGVGEALMGAATAWAEGRGCRMVALATRRASAFYAALGYEASATYFRKIIDPPANA